MREPKKLMMVTFLKAISHTDSRYSSLCWMYMSLSSLGDVISCRGRGREELSSQVEVRPRLHTLTQTPTHTHTQTCRNIQEWKWHMLRNLDNSSARCGDLFTFDWEGRKGGEWRGGGRGGGFPTPPLPPIRYHAGNCFPNVSHALIP